MNEHIPAPSLKRLPIYYRRLKDAVKEKITYVSSDELGQSAGVPAAQVRKDLSYLEEKGRPGVGYNAESLAKHLEGFLGLTEDKKAALIGVGNLGKALVLYPGFARYGLSIVALFDNDPAKTGHTVAGLEILPVKALMNAVPQMDINIGLITAPAQAAQEIANAMVESGIKAIWNFAPTRLEVPDDVFVKNEDLASELAVLSHYVKRDR